MKKQVLQCIAMSYLVLVGSPAYGETSHQPPRSTVLGPRILKVGEIGQFITVDENGVPYAGVRDSSSSFKGVMLVDGSSEPEFAEECDGNEYTVAVSFSKPGLTEVWCKYYMEGKNGDPAIMRVVVIPADSKYPQGYGRHNSKEVFVVGIDTLEVGEVGVYMVVDTDGNIFYTSNKDAEEIMSGIMQVAPDMDWEERTGHEVSADYATFHIDPDGNAYTVAVSFNEVGLFQVRCKYVIGQDGDMAHKVVHVVPKGYFSRGR